jgi:hypothetical protein
MLVDVRDTQLVQVTLFFEAPQTHEQQVKLDYILNNIFELESDYHEDQ